MMPGLRLFIALALGALVAACSEGSSLKWEEQPPFKIAVVGPMSGPYTSYGGQLRYGVGQAIDTINVRGGLLKHQLTIRAVDDRCDPKRAESIARGLATEKVTLVIGNFCSAAARAAAPIYGEKGILEIAPSASDAALTDEAAARGDGNVFRVVPRDDRQGPVLVQYLLAHASGRALALLREETSYGRAVVDSGRRALEGAGLRPTVDEALPVEEEALPALVARLKAQNVTVALYGGRDERAALLLREARRQGLPILLAGGDGLATEAFGKQAGQAAEGTILTALPDPHEFRNARDAEAGLARFGVDIGGYTLYAHAAVQVFAEAARKAGSLSTEAVAKALRDGQYDTVIGPLSFDEKGDRRDSSYVLYVWHNGRIQRL